MLKNSFIKLACISPKVEVGLPLENAKEIIKGIKDASKKGVAIISTPELALTGYSCGDLFLQDKLINGAEDALKVILKDTGKTDIISIIGMPIKVGNNLLSCAVVINKGNILGVVPKNNLGKYNGYDELRWFKNGNDVEAAAKLIDCGAYKMIQLPDSKLTDWGITRVNTERIVPIEIPSQQNLTENHIIKLENGQFVSKNKSVKIEHEIGSVVINITVEGNTAKIERKLDMNSTVIQKSDILKMKEIVDAWNDDNLMRLIIK
jgi:hypothetical protein